MSKQPHADEKRYDHRREVILDCLIGLQRGTRSTDRLAILEVAIDLCANLLASDKGVERAGAYFEKVARRLRRGECV